MAKRRKIDWKKSVPATDGISDYSDSSNSNNISDDELNKHQKNFTDLLAIYVSNTDSSAKLKNKLKRVFFIVAIIAWLAPLAILAWTLRFIGQQIQQLQGINNINAESIVGMVTIITPSFVSIIVAFLKIPEIIAKYLFNPEEDSNMNSVIENIQKHDKDMLELEMKKNKKAEEVLLVEKLNDEQIKTKIAPSFSDKMAVLSSSVAEKESADSKKTAITKVYNTLKNNENVEELFDG